MARKTRKATEAERAQYEAGTKPFYDIINSFPWGTLNEETLAARKGLEDFRERTGFYTCDYGLRIRLP